MIALILGTKLHQVLQLMNNAFGMKDLAERTY